MDGIAHKGASSKGAALTLLPFSHEEFGLMYEFSAPELLSIFTWRGVQALAAGVMSVLHQRTGRNSSFWFEPIEGRNPMGLPDIVLRLWFVLDQGSPSELDEAAVRRSLRAADSRIAYRGTCKLSEAAHPSLALAEGEIHQAWLVDPPDVVAPFLLWNDDNDELEILGARRNSMAEADLLTCHRHALLIYPDDSVLRT